MISCFVTLAVVSLRPALSKDKKRRESGHGGEENLREFGRRRNRGNFGGDVLYERSMYFNKKFGKEKNEITCLTV